MSEIKPSLDFGGLQVTDHGGDIEIRVSYAGQSARMFAAGPTRHSLAALALYGQPFGFTKEDLNLIRHVPYAPYKEAGRAKEYGRLQTIGDRIATFLPPED